MDSEAASANNHYGADQDAATNIDDDVCQAF
jgi:hypothetical protein